MFFRGVREQKQAKMLPWGCTTPVIRLLLRGLHRHGSKKRLKRSRGFARPSIYAFCGRCCNCTVAKMGKNVAMGCFFMGVGYEKSLKRSHGFARPSIYASCGRCWKSTVTKMGKNVAMGCFFMGVGYKKSLKRSHAFARPSIQPPVVKSWHDVF